MPPRIEKITKRSVDAAKGEAKLYRLWDSEVKGFGLRVMPTGVKSYICAYRPHGGGRAISQQEYTIGRHGIFTPDQAREEAIRVLGLVRQGHDPQGARSAARKELNVSELCDLYLAEGVTLKKATTLRSDRARIERHIKPLLGRKPVSVITDADIQRFLRDVASGKSAVVVKPTKAEAKGTDVQTRKRSDPVASGGRGTATRTVGLLGAIFSFAVSRKLLPSNPVHGVKRFRDGQSQRYLSADEMGRLGQALASLSPDNKAAAVLRLLIFTGARKTEIEGLRWDAVDFERRCLRLADSKTGPKVIPVGVPAIAILEEIKHAEGSPFVFPAEGDLNRHFVGTPRVWVRVRSTAGIAGVRLHDLRHTYASLAVGSGQSLPLIGKLLGHRDVKTTAQYAHIADHPVAAAANTTAQAAARALAGK